MSGGVFASLAFAALAAAPIRRKLLATASLLPAFAGLAYWHLWSPPVQGQAKLTPALAWGVLKRHRLDDLGRSKLLDDLSRRLLLIPSHAMRAFVDQVNVPACKGLFLIMVAYVLVGLAAWPAADRMMAAPRNGNELFDTAIYLAIGEWSDIR